MRVHKLVGEVHHIARSVDGERRVHVVYGSARRRGLSDVVHRSRARKGERVGMMFYLCSTSH